MELRQLDLGIRSNGARFLTGAFTSTTALATVNAGTTEVSVSADITLSSTYHRANAGLTLGAVDYKNNLFSQGRSHGWEPQRPHGHRAPAEQRHHVAACRGEERRIRERRHLPRDVRTFGNIVTMRVGTRSISYTLTSADRAAFGSATRVGFRAHVAPDEDDGGSVFDTLTVTSP